MSVALVVRRTIRASPERLFAAWTDPRELQRWWGPPGITAVDIELDLRVGGAYRIGNRAGDGSVVWIEGTFESITPPSELIYTWRIGPKQPERVTVRFKPATEGTEVIVVHERVPEEDRVPHEQGWHGCLDGLANLLT